MARTRARYPKQVAIPSIIRVQQRINVLVAVGVGKETKVSDGAGLHTTDEVFTAVA